MSIKGRNLIIKRDYILKFQLYTRDNNVEKLYTATHIT